MSTTSTRTVRISHSPDSDDAFMFCGIAERHVNVGGYNFVVHSAEIDALNQKAMEEDAVDDVYAISFAAFPYLADRYMMLASGASMAGSDYGPKLVSKKHRGELRDVAKKQKLKIAVPGKYTTAYLVMQLYLIKEVGTLDIEPVFCKFNEIFDLLNDEEQDIDAGLLIHESQMQFREQGFKELANFGKWWFEDTNGLLLPLGCNVIKKELDDKVEIAKIVQKSVKWGLNNRSEATRYAMEYANSGLDEHMTRKYIKMYVNESSVELSQNDRKSIQLLLKLAVRNKLVDIPDPHIVDHLHFL